MAPDETGKRYGKLLVLSRDKRNDNRAYWHCVCDCGTKISCMGHSLRSGNTASCGCTRTEKARARWTKPPGHAAFRKALNTMKGNARRRGLEWGLSEDDVKRVAAMNCHYCGAPPSNEIKATFDSYRYNGIDRVDNSRGYVNDNVAPCCAACNTAKSAMSLDEFYSWVARVYAKMEGVKNARAVLC